MLEVLRDIPWFLTLLLAAIIAVILIMVWVVFERGPLNGNDD